MLQIAEKLPTSRRGQATFLSIFILLWVGAYRVNGWVWNHLLYNLFGMAPTARLTETVRFFFYDTVKIGLLLIGITFAVTVLRSVPAVRSLPL